MPGEVFFDVGYNDAFDLRPFFRLHALELLIV